MYHIPSKIYDNVICMDWFPEFSTGSITQHHTKKKKIPEASYHLCHKEKQWARGKHLYMQIFDFLLQGCVHFLRMETLFNSFLAISV